MKPNFIQSFCQTFCMQLLQNHILTYMFTKPFPRKKLDCTWWNSLPYLKANKLRQAGRMLEKVIALPHAAHACNKLWSWQSIRHCFTLAFDHKPCEHQPKLCTWLILAKPCSLKMCHPIHILCELCGNELVFLRGRALLFTQACNKIAWKSFQALSKIPFFAYPAIMAVHGTSFLSSFQASSERDQ